MRIRQVNGLQLLSKETRQRLESIIFTNPATAAQSIQRYFPHHVICADPGRLRVAVRDLSLFVAEFKQIP